jgi:hypothetical protein
MTSATNPPASGAKGSAATTSEGSGGAATAAGPVDLRALCERMERESAAALAKLERAADASIEHSLQLARGARSSRPSSAGIPRAPAAAADGSAPTAAPAAPVESGLTDRFRALRADGSAAPAAVARARR